MTDEILQCGPVEDKINIFEKIGEGDGDRAASSVRCRSRSQTSEGCGALLDPLQLRQNPNLPRFRSVVGAGGHTPPSAPTSSSLRQFGSPFYVDDDSGGHAPPSAPTQSSLRHVGSPFYADDDLQNMENIPVVDMSPMRGGGFAEVLSDGDGLAASTVSSATVRSKDFVGANAGLCVRRQKAVRELDFSDVNPRVCSQNSAGELDTENLTACNAPVRHVSFAETAEVVEFDPASPDAEVQPAPVAEHAWHMLTWSSTTFQHRIWRTGYMRHLLPWLNTKLHRPWRTWYTRHLLPWLSTTLQ